MLECFSDLTIIQPARVAEVLGVEPAELVKRVEPKGGGEEMKPTD